jgi:Trk K+ transport system NAD-binding subunit
MRESLIQVLIVTGAVLVVGVLVFQVGLNLSWLDAVYFVITTITTVGYGDISLLEAPWTLKLFGIVLMVLGVVSMAAIIGIVTDFLVQSRLQEFFGGRRRRMQDHIVLCGLGNVGFRVLEHLLRLGQEVVVIEKDEDCKFIPEARKMGVSVIVGDIRTASALEEAEIAKAKCLISVSDEDLANLESALNARAVKEQIRVVLRMFDQGLANKIRDGFGIHTAFSTSALAAPAFAMAAVDPAVIGSFYVGEDLMLNMQVTINERSRLASMTTRDLEKEGDVSILALTSAATGKRRLHPSEPTAMQAGDTLVVSTVPQFAGKLHQMNTPEE